MSTPEVTGSSRLDKILEIAAKVQAAASVFSPVLGGYAALGVGIVKTIVGAINAVKGPGEPDITLPSDAELINRLEATSQRVADTGNAFLHEGDTQA